MQENEVKSEGAKQGADFTSDFVRKLPISNLISDENFSPNRLVFSQKSLQKTPEIHPIPRRFPLKNKAADDDFLQIFTPSAS